MGGHWASLRVDGKLQKAPQPQPDLLLLGHHPRSHVYLRVFFMSLLNYPAGMSGVPTSKVGEGRA